MREYKRNTCCYLLDLNGKILKEFNNLQACSRFLNKTQLNKLQYNSGSVVSKKYRIFTKYFYNNNIDKIKKLSNISNATDIKKTLSKDKFILICDLFPDIEFKNAVELSKYMEDNHKYFKMTSAQILNVAKGITIKNIHNIRYKNIHLTTIPFYRYNIRGNKKRTFKK